MVTKERTRHWLHFFIILLSAGCIILHYYLSPWGYYWKVDPDEEMVRNLVVERAAFYLGIQESDGSHMQIIDLYNSQETLPVGYTMSQTDSWCAAFVTAVAMDCGLTDILPPECSCGRQIELFKELGRWTEDDRIIPLPGDIIYYDWDVQTLGNCTGWPEHVGIVVGTKWPFIKVIEGNKDDCVSYRYLFINDIHIRGYGKPDYASKNIP